MGQSQCKGKGSARASVNVSVGVRASVRASVHALVRYSPVLTKTMYSAHSTAESLVRESRAPYTLWGQYTVKRGQGVMYKGG